MFSKTFHIIKFVKKIYIEFQYFIFNNTVCKLIIDQKLKRILLNIYKYPKKILNKPFFVFHLSLFKCFIYYIFLFRHFLLNTLICLTRQFNFFVFMTFCIKKKSNSCIFLFLNICNYNLKNTY